MKTMQSGQLLDKLEKDTRQIILTIHYLLQEDPGVLLQQPAPGKWSVAQVTEHLNSYGRYYLPLMKQALDNSPYKANASFTPGWLGNYFTRSMLPTSDGRITHKMQAPKNHRPSPDIDSFAVLHEFMEQEKLLLALLDKARDTDLNKLRIPISITKFIKLKLGDTFRFLIAHHQRHFVQINNTLAIVKKDHGYTFPKASFSFDTGF